MTSMAFVGPMSDITDNSHSLLEPPSPAYTNVTVRRAFIVWMYCGQRNKFKDVCNYFHYLEALEDQLSPEQRALSRHHEFNLFSNHPPTSTYLIDNYPQLYKESCVERHYISKVEDIRNEKCVFKLEGFNEIAPKKGTTTQEIVEASRMIRKYCRIQMISLKKFLEEFKLYARKCDLNYTVNNAAFYIKRKMVQAEIELEVNYPKTLGFLNSGSSENILNVQGNTTINSNTKNAKADLVSKKADVNNFKPIKILRKDEANPVDEIKNLWNCNDKTKNVDNTYSKKDEINCGISNVIENDHVILDRQYLEDLYNGNEPFKKERRFSGSRFMKIELEKLRKI